MGGASRTPHVRPPPPPASLQAAAHKAAFDALASRAILGTKWGKGANPHSLKGVTFCEVRTGPWVWAMAAGSGCKGEKLGTCQKTRALGEHPPPRSPPRSPAARRPGKLQRWARAPPSTAPLPNPGPSAAEFPPKCSLDQNTPACLSLGPSLTVP